MNINISYNWLKEYLDTKLKVEDFAFQTTEAGNSVEYIDDQKKRFEKMVVGEILEVNKHPNADKLKVVETKIGSGKNVEIVCGGVNLKQGQKVVVALPGAKVYWHGEDELIELVETKIRGIKSHGMICAAEELGFAKLPQGEKEIWDISDITDAAAGTAVSKALDLEDYILDIEVTTNRPDAMSIIGQAREGGAVTGPKFTWKPSELKSGEQSSLQLKVSEKKLCPKYQAVLIEGVKVGPSPWWLQKRLLLAGHRPINNIVDITNYVLHEYGQPMHAFDADTLESDEIIVRNANPNEKIKALDGNDYKLNKDTLVIADSKKAIAIAGVMGGEKTGTTEKTTRIILESATFDPVSVRKTARNLNLYSDSQLLFEKGLSTESTEPALIRAIELVKEIAGAETISKIATHESTSYKTITFPFDPVKARALIGVDIQEKKMLEMLKSLGFKISPLTKGGSKGGSKYEVEIPYWRDHDIENERDFVEEIARLYGYEKIPSILPVGELAPTQSDPILFWERKVKELLRGAGLTESYSYSFISEKELSEAGMKNAVKVENPLSSDQDHMRPSLIPSMLSTIERNEKQFESAALFEIAPVYIPRKNDLPDQPLKMLIAVYDQDGYTAFRKAKGIFERLLKEVGIKDWDIEIETRDNIALIDIDFEAFCKQATTSVSYTPVPLFPAVKRDLAFVVDEKKTFASIKSKLKSGSDLLETIELFDIYRGKGIDPGKKSMALHFEFRSKDKTLEAKEVDQEMDKLRKMLEKDFSAIMRS